MSDWLADVAGEGYATAIIWTLAALILLVVLLVAARVVRSLTAGTFVAGGRNRAPRLAVVDATAVDNQRRLVLVRRDDVEHLILIGGPSDVVVEQRIPVRDQPETNVPQAPRAETAAPLPPAAHPQRKATPPAPEPARPEPSPAAETAPRAPSAATSYRIHPRPTVEPTLPETPSRPRDWPQRDQEPVAERRREEPMASDARQTAEGTVKKEEDEAARQRPNISIEDEMSRLLDELSEERGKR